jgi:hypothetical protein
MAVYASNLGVLSLQAERHSLVVEVSQPILPIVAIQAACAEILDVLNDKSRILFRMAHRTIGF